ncbi:hypothetical protein UFOVP1447_1, partial [uncultured Caudovirales phage]
RSGQYVISGTFISGDDINVTCVKAGFEFNIAVITIP